MHGFVSHYLEAHDLRILRDEEARDIRATLAKHMEAVVFNVVSLAAVMAVLKGNKEKISTRHLPSVRDYLSARGCAGAAAPAAAAQSGGSAMMPSEYFGYAHPAYQAGNAGDGVNTSDIQFAAGIARAAMGPQEGGDSRSRSPQGKGSKHIREATKVLREEVEKVARHHDTAVSKGAMSELVAIIHDHLDCLAADLKAAGAALTESKVAKVLALKRHAAFS